MVRSVVTILLLSTISTLVLADDAGSGSDAGGSSSSATPLNPTNATYYGNLSSTDTSDFYSISMPNGTGVYVGLTSPTGSDFDLYLYDSGNSQIDSSLSTSSYDEVTSNGTSIGGTTVYIEVRQWSGSGQYSMQIWVFSEPQGPAQNDAGTGSDAGDTSTSATPLSSSNQTVPGWISDTFDPQDWYNISVPSGNGIYVTMSFPNGSTSGSQLALIESTATYYIQYDYTSPYEVTSNGTNVGGGYVFIRVLTSSDEGYYNLTITLFSTAGQPGSSQDDAGSGMDAGDSAGAALQINMTSNTTTFEGWVDNNWDSSDYYSVFVPTNWTSWASLSWLNTSADLDLYLYDSNQTTLAYSYFDNPETVSGNSSSISGTTIYYNVVAYSGNDLYYNLTIGIANLSDSPAFNQNDANSGGDAGDDFSTALGLPNDNGTYYGWISESLDTDDIYSVQIPSGYAIEVNLSWNNSANDFDLGLYDGAQSMIDSSTSDNPETVESGSTDVSNSTVYVLVQSSAGWWGTGGEGNYTLEITLVNQSEVPGLNQNDAYTGEDAGDEYSNATPLVNATPVFSIWPGYVDSGSDEYDYYQVYVPVDHGITVELSPGYGQSNWLALTLYDSANSQVDYDYYSNPQTVSTNGTGSNLGGSNVVIEVSAYNGGDQYNLSLWIFSLDADGDGFYDEDEYACGSDPYDNTSIPVDTDADGLCDILDEDIDGDGVDNANDSFPDDANETTDSDGDGTGDNSDPDDDNDGWSDSHEYSCGTDGYDPDSFPDDLDSDGICDILDEDIDGDGYDNPSDSFDYDSEEWNDTDSDGIGDNSDGDDDGDGFYDGVEVDCLSDPLDLSSVPVDTDSDGVCDELDDDVDGDGIGNDFDDFPFDDSESTDTDGDGIGDASDPDDDNDGYQDAFDSFPLDSSEWNDNDGDLVGDNADPDDDNDGWDDVDETNCGTNPSLMQSAPDDWDGDRLCDVIDPDDDNDAWNDTVDAFPYDPNEWDDLDGDNHGSNSDPDDDGDGWSDSDELSICGTDARDSQSVPDDFDGDRICDNLDDDDDNDLVLDFDDAFPKDPTETKDTDGDGQGDGDDADDDNDGWADVTEVVCETSPISSEEIPADFDGDLTCDLIDPDDDNDGVIDQEDAFPYDSEEWVDRNSDGLGDNANPLTIMDKMKLNPEVSIIAIGSVAAMLSATMAFLFGRSRLKEQYDEDQSWVEEDEDEDDYYADWEYQQ
jgi:hypothetical protein